MAKTFLVTVTNDLNQDQRMHRICTSLQKEGYGVLLLGREKAKSTSLLDHSFDQKRLKCFFTKGFLFYLEYNIRLLFFALNYKPDVIYAVDLDTMLAAGIASKFLKNKLIHDAHEYFVEVPELEGESFKKWIWNKIGLRFVPMCDLCITVNQELAKILSEKYKNKFQIVRSIPFINSKDHQAKKSNEVPIILYQGVLNKGRGLEEALKAVSKLNEEFIFRIAGEGDLSIELRTLVDELKIGKKVTFLGWLTPNQLKEETAKADIGLNLLSAMSLNYKYSLANKFFDYMHAGVPSINMNFPVYKRICDEFEVGICIESLDQVSIQNAILSLINDNEKRIRIEKACELAKIKYNWENESSHLLHLIRSL